MTNVMMFDDMVLGNMITPVLLVITWVILCTLVWFCDRF